MSRGPVGARAEFGVLVVGGFASQSRGDALAAFGGALYRWLFRWNAKAAKAEWPGKYEPLLGDAVLSGGEAGPAHLTLSVRLPLRGREPCDAKWLIAESCWASIFDVPEFLGLARWIWKVSTCLLVLQFIIPMRRHSRQAGCAWSQRKRLLALSDAVSAMWYALLMAMAATLSVLLSLVLLALAVADKLPIPRIDATVRWVVVRVSCILGDSYMLAHCPVQFAAMRTQVARDLNWLQAHCARVAIVAHSQGAAVAHQVLLDMNRRRNLRAFVTLGQGISKFRLLQKMDWDSKKQGKVFASRALVTVGMACAGLPALGGIASNWAGVSALTAVSALPWAALLIAAGVGCIAVGVWTAMSAFCGEPAADLNLPARKGFSWTDYYTSADPVSNGPVERAEPATESNLPQSMLAYSNASVLTDHVSYLRNQDQVLPHVFNDLVAAAYSQDGHGKVELVADDDITRACKNRHALNFTLITARIATAIAAAYLW